MIGRLGRFVAGSYPPLPAILFAVAWAYGVTGLYAAVDPRPVPWRPDAGTALAAVTLVIDLLLMRAVDDIRDLDYDRRHNPARPLASGAVRVSDLVVLLGVGSVAVVALNAGNPAGAAILAVQLGYALVLLAVDQRLHRLPCGNAVVVNVLIGFPVQVLLHLYLYVGYLRTTGLRPDRSVLLAMAVVVLASLHLELAKKVIRSPRPGTRTYVTVFGLAGTAGLAVATAYASAAVLLAAMRPAHWYVLVPLLPVTFTGWRFWRTRAPRWPAASAALYLLLAYASYLAVGLG
jgi:hypothetical protein